jgi:hypothetical protein
MERLAQLLDDLDDVFSTIGLARERIRGIALLSVLVLVWLLVQASAVALALRHPRFALATAMLMFTLLLYRAVTAAPGFQDKAGQAPGLHP